MDSRKNEREIDDSISQIFIFGLWNFVKRRKTSYINHNNKFNRMNSDIRTF